MLGCCQKTLELMVVGVTAAEATRPDRPQRITLGFSFPQNLPDLCSALVDGVLRADLKKTKNGGCLDRSDLFTASQKQKEKRKEKERNPSEQRLRRSSSALSA